MKQFTWHCGASVLVDDAYEKFDVKASSVDEAWNMAMEHVRKSKVLDEGSVDMQMDLTEMATELGNLASGNNEEWKPIGLLNELTQCKDNYELLCTLESIICNANMKGELD